MILDSLFVANIIWQDVHDHTRSLAYIRLHFKIELCLLYNIIQGGVEGGEQRVFDQDSVT